MRLAKGFFTTSLFILGCVAICLALIVSGEDYSNVLLRTDGKDLSWGPTLFRGLLLFHGGLLVAYLIFRDRLGLSRFRAKESAKLSVLLKNRNTILLLVGLSALALVLRLINLNSDLWVDEVLTLLGFVRRPIGEIVTSFPSQNQHMFYSVLGRLSFDLFGESPWALRLPSVLFGVASIWAVYLLAKDLIGNRVAVLSALLMTFSYHHIWFSQNARGYMGLLFFSLLGTWFWFVALRSNTATGWILYSVSVVLGMWMHMTMAFLVAAHGIVYVAILIWSWLSETVPQRESQERKAGWRPLVAWALSVTCTLQLYALSLPEFLRDGLHEESKESVWTNPIWVITESINGLSVGFAGLSFVLLGACFVAFGWFSLFKKDGRLAIVMVLPGLLAGLTMATLGHNLWPRFFFFSMGFGIIILVYGAVELPLALKRLWKNMPVSDTTLKRCGTVFAGLMILVSATTVTRNYAMPKQDFSGAQEYVNEELKSGDRIIAVGLADFVYRDYLAPDWTIAESGEELKRLQDHTGDVWLVYTLPIEIKAFRPDIWTVVQEDYETIRSFPGTLNGGEVHVAKRKNREDKLK